MRLSTSASALLFGVAVSAFDLPDNLRQIYEQHKSGGCAQALSQTFDGGAAYCGDIANSIFLKGDGQYDNLDIDCDGANRSAGDCANDQTGQDQTSFKDTVSQFGIEDLDANLHSYVVFGTADFNPEAHGMRPLSVMAVVCNNQLFYGVWGDTNGFSSTGEASLALGQLCFPNDGLTGDNGHAENDILYIGFMGDDAVPGANGANWNAGSREDFQASLQQLGDRLVASL